MNNVLLPSDQICLFLAHSSSLPSHRCKITSCLLSKLLVLAHSSKLMSTSQAPITLHPRRSDLSDRRTRPVYLHFCFCFAANVSGGRDFHGRTLTREESLLRRGGGTSRLRGKDIREHNHDSERVRHTSSEDVNENDDQLPGRESEHLLARYEADSSPPQASSIRESQGLPEPET